MTDTAIRPMSKANDNIRGAGFLALGLLILSLQDVSVKWIGGDYSVFEIVILRTLIALPCTVLFFRFEGKRGLPKTGQRRLEILRGLVLFFSFTAYVTGLRAIPLADAAAIRFSTPLMITLLSVVVLREKVGPWRWLAIAMGFIGVLFIVKPGGTTFNLGSVFVLISQVLYALAVMITRKLQTTDSSATMAYYSSLVYLAAAFIVAPLALMVGEMPEAHPSIAFLFRAWTLPTLLDWVIMSGLGLVWAGGMYFIARGYSLAQASVAAPFEYVILPINIMWGLTLWGEVPTWSTIAGALLTLGSGMFVLYRERADQKN